MTVRARSERDMRNLADLVSAEPSRDDRTDYRWRIRCRKSEWADAVSVMAKTNDYDNFKSRIALDDATRAHLLSRAWDVLYGIHRQEE